MTKKKPSNNPIEELKALHKKDPAAAFDKLALLAYAYREWCVDNQLFSEIRPTGEIRSPEAERREIDESVIKYTLPDIEAEQAAKEDAP